ncbi:hypothetical protein CHS0354_040761 [Potamilus streckersoni]|uniref:Uncharacterized protein n=1 Tax=Potamilus streckersoni TaxID=2493646 RepID=A0AAE0VXV1_9BIVA|nr:hypothetical protein CHS0354_040761 [Potamilus streckersoni]
MDPTVSSGTMDPTIPMTLQHFPYLLPVCRDCGCMGHINPTSKDPSFSSISATINPTVPMTLQHFPYLLPVCSQSECMGPMYTEQILHPSLRVKHEIPPTRIHLSPVSSGTINPTVPMTLQQILDPSLCDMQEIPPTWIHPSPVSSGRRTHRVPMTLQHFPYLLPVCSVCGCMEDMYTEQILHPCVYVMEEITPTWIHPSPVSSGKSIPQYQ